jgi:excisionase family DNA binding protein
MTSSEIIEGLMRTPEAREVLRELIREEIAAARLSAPPVDEGDLTVRDVAKLRGVTSRTVYEWVSRRLIRYKRTPSGRLRFARADVDKLQIAGL